MSSAHQSALQGLSSLPPLSAESFSKSVDFACDPRNSFADSAQQSFGSSSQSFGSSSFASSRNLPNPENHSSRSIGAPSIARINQSRPQMPDHSSSFQETSSAAKAARKAKPHVQAACCHCKKAHLACDNSRPCQRCVTNGKADTCRNVEHKKRGRPRLRDARGEKVPQANRFPNTQSLTLNTQALSHKDIRPAYPRYPQSQGMMPGTDSYGRRYTTEMLSVGHDRYGMGASIFNNTVNLSNEAIAFLDMELKFHRANDSFKNHFFGVRLESQRLDDLVDAGYLGTVQWLRSQIKGEQQARDAQYLTHLRADNQNQIPDVAYTDWQTASSSYTQRKQTIAFRVGVNLQPMSISLRLAKHELTYFAVLWLSPWDQETGRMPSPIYPQSAMPYSTSGSSFGSSQQWPSSSSGTQQFSHNGNYTLMSGNSAQSMDSYATQSLQSASHSPAYYSSYQAPITSPLAGRGDAQSFNYMSQPESATIPRSAHQNMYYNTGYPAGISQTQSAPTSATADQRYFFPGQDMLAQQNQGYTSHADSQRQSYAPQTSLPPIGATSYDDDDDNERRKRRRMDITGMVQQ